MSGQCGWRGAGSDGGEQSALGRLATAHRCPASQPALKGGEIRPARKRGTPPSRRLAVAIRRNAAGAVEQGKVGLPFRQKGKEVAERNKDRHADAPTVAVVNPEQCGLPHDIRWRHAGRKLAVNGFGGDKAQDMLKAVVEPPAPMRCRFGVAEGGPHTDFAITHHGGAGRRGRPHCSTAVSESGDTGETKKAAPTVFGDQALTVKPVTPLSRGATSASTHKQTHPSPSA